MLFRSHVFFSLSTDLAFRCRTFLFVLRQGVSECPESFGTNRGEHQLQCEICGSIDACKTGGQGQGI